MQPEDQKDFGEEALPALRAAVTELSWLLDRGYSRSAALDLAGDRHQLSRRQRKAVSRCAASSDDVERRNASRLEADELQHATLRVDGYNVLLVVVSAVLGAPLLIGRDGVYRDVTSLSRLKKSPEALDVAVRWTADALGALHPDRVVFHLDRPLSGSGELRGLLKGVGGERELPWEARLEDDPDCVLKESTDAVATGDSAILDACPGWIDLARLVIDPRSRDGECKPWRVDLSRDRDA